MAVSEAFITKLSREAVGKQAMGWVIEHLATSFCAGEPEPTTDSLLWRVPILLAYPFMVVGEVGELLIDGVSGELRPSPGPMQMKAKAGRLAKERDAEIQAAFVHARNS